MTLAIVIAAPGQSGRSTFVGRLCEEARSSGKIPVQLDIAQFPDDSLLDANRFFGEFVGQIAYKLAATDFRNILERRWAGGSYITRCQGCLRDLLMGLPDRPRVSLLLDGVDRLLGFEFRRDFFALLNLCRPSDDPLWNRLDIVVATADEPGRHGLKFVAIPLPPFSLEETRNLNSAYGSTLEPERLADLHKLVAGRPYLLQICLYYVAMGVTPSADVLDPNAFPLSSALGTLQAQINDQKLTDGVREVVERQRCSDEEVFCKLRALGVVGNSRLPVQFICPLYKDYFSGI